MQQRGKIDSNLRSTMASESLSFLMDDGAEVRNGNSSRVEQNCRQALADEISSNLPQSTARVSLIIIQEIA
jgi:hypothetical protein